MVVGVAFSELIDKPEKRMNFGTDELDNADALWYKSLTTVQDEIGSLQNLKFLHGKGSKTSLEEAPPSRRKGQKISTPDGPEGQQSGAPNLDSSISTSASKSNARSNQAISKIVSIQEIEDEEEDGVSSDELTPYEKPDSDPEDEDEDPTLVQRNKPTAPV